MKKRVLLCVCALVLLLAGCAYKECSLCGEKGFGETKEFLGAEVFVCRDCQKDIQEMKDDITGLFD